VTTAASSIPIALRRLPAPLILAGLAFLVAFATPLITLGRDWWSDLEAGHGLLLFPVALWLAWKRGLVDARPQPALGIVLLVGAVLLRYLSGLAAELFTMRASLLGAVLGLIVYARGWRQLVAWWLPILLIALSIPLPAVLLGSLALPLQLKASEWGATLLELRSVPVRLSGNVIQLPGRALFVTEACSGLRSLTALLALGLLVGGLWLRTWWGRSVLVLAAIPVAMALNAVRIFLTGFLVFFVDPSLAEGVMHYSEGWAMFVVAFAILGAITWLLSLLEGLLRRRAKAAA
jgi:exosortase